jgi:hypothetical protein
MTEMFNIYHLTPYIIYVSHTILHTLYIIPISPYIIYITPVPPTEVEISTYRDGWLKDVTINVFKFNWEVLTRYCNRYRNLAKFKFNIIYSLKMTKSTCKIDYFRKGEGSCWALIMISSVTINVLPPTI